MRSARAGRTEHARDRWQRASVRAALVARLARVAYLAPVALSAALPWAWFAVRDAIGPVTDVLAIALPAVVVFVGVLLPWLPPHDAATRPTASNTDARRARGFLDEFRDNMRPPGHGEFRHNLNTSLYIRKQRLAPRDDGC